MKSKIKHYQESNPARQWDDDDDGTTTIMMMMMIIIIIITHIVSFASGVSVPLLV
jgi:hypothetical protein